jgi:hypothetical protein
MKDWRCIDAEGAPVPGESRSGDQRGPVSARHRRTRNTPRRLTGPRAFARLARGKGASAELRPSGPARRRFFALRSCAPRWCASSGRPDTPSNVWIDMCPSRRMLDHLRHDDPCYPAGRHGGRGSEWRIRLRCFVPEGRYGQQAVRYDRQSAREWGLPTEDAQRLSWRGDCWHTDHQQRWTEHDRQGTGLHRTHAIVQSVYWDVHRCRSFPHVWP